jgi:hypothetical protein
MTWVQLLLLALLPVLAYLSTLNNYFLNSDFAHIHYASKALQTPELFLKEFTTSWLGAFDFELAYRPLPLFILAFNLLVSGVQPFTYHLTSLTLHVMSAWCVFFFTRELMLWRKTANTDIGNGEIETYNTEIKTAFLAAALFALYPVNAETINWIGALPDCAGGLFFILTLLLWMIEQRTGKKRFAVLSMVSYLVALLFQELPVTLVFIPPLLCLIKPIAWKEKLLLALRSSWKLLVVLCAYLLVRWMALGTIVGGYKAAFWKLLGTEDYLTRWAQPEYLKMLFFPFNPDLHHILPMQAVYAGLYALVLLVVLSKPKSLKTLFPFLIFFVLWFFICLFPGLRTAALTHALSTGRLFYLSSIPLALSLAVLLAQPGSTAVQWRKIVAAVSGIGFIAAFMLTDVVNNQVWNKAARSTRALQLQLAKLIAQTPPEIKVAVLNPPLSLGGPYGLNQALLPLTQNKPFLRDANYHRVLMLDREHFVERDANLINATAFRQYLLSACVVAKWNPSTALLNKVVLIPDMMPLSAHNVSVSEIESGRADARTFEIVIDPSLIPLSCEALEVEFSSEGTTRAGFAELAWRENWREKAKDVYDTDAFVGVDGDAKMHKYRFSLAEQVGWYMQPTIETLHLTIHNLKAIKNVSARLATDADYVPRLRPDQRYLKTSPIGWVPRANQAVFFCDTEVEGATGLLIELSQPNECFETYARTYRETTSSANALKRWISRETSTSFRIPLGELAPGFYSVRAASIDSKDYVLGAFGDPVVFRVVSSQ